jgi:hypothetical protein
MHLVITGQFQSALPAIAIDIHANGLVIEFVLGVNLLGFVVLVEQQGQ